MKIETRASALFTALRRVLPAISESNHHPGLDVVVWHITPTRLVLSAADGFVVAEAEVDLPITADDTAVVRLPSSTMATLVRELEAMYGTVTITAELNQWFFDLGATTLTCVAFTGKPVDLSKAWKATRDDDGKPPVINARYLQALTQHAPVNVTITARGSENPVILSGDHYRAIIMPMKWQSTPAASLLDEVTR